MNEIATIKGLPKTNQVLPEFFKPIDCVVEEPFFKHCFMEAYCIYRVITSGNAVHMSTEAISTVIVKDKKGKNLMYAYVIEYENEYILMEIGFTQVYEVDKDKIDVEECSYLRLPFAETEEGLVIMVRSNTEEKYVYELLLRKKNTNEEQKLAFTGGSLEDAVNFLKSKSSIKGFCLKIRISPAM